MQDTVDQAHGAVPRILADIIEDARRAVCGHCCADSPAWRARFPAPDGLHLARFARARLRGLISEAPMAAKLAENGAWAWPILLARSYLTQGMRMLAVTWTNDARGRSAFWLHAAVRHGIWPSVDDQLVSCRGHRQILLATFPRPKTAFPQLKSPFKRHADVT
jgi:hypothetical protein